MSSVLKSGWVEISHARITIIRLGGNLKKQDEPEADIVVAVGRAIVETISRAAVIGIVTPTATAQHTARPRRRTIRISQG